uniref:C3H1-type domain-containing protein n=1 Tax=Trypanosoma congolense (strain IL3000) TaxID=1068625 RepID=G0US89_TRYCI|nr:conserved hypothetical protein [Trypanosoma congolense IL3000]
MLQRTVVLFPAVQRSSIRHRYRKAGTKRRKVSQAQKGKSVNNVRDVIGMTIPEVRLRRDRISPAAFDRCIKEHSRGIIDPTPDGPSDAGRFGALFDRREVHFTGRSGDVRRFVESATRCVANGRWLGGRHADAVAFVRGVSDGADEPANGYLLRKSASDDSTPASVGMIGSSSHPLLRRALRRRGDNLRPSSSPAGVLAAGAPGVFPATDESSGNTCGPSGEQKESTGDSVVAAVSPGRRRAERRLRCQSAFLAGSGDSVHPCSLQGGCKSPGGISHCALAAHPSTVCLQWLQSGSCEDARRCSCPWWHPGDVEIMRLESLRTCFFNAAPGCEEKARELKDLIVRMGTLLQMFLDIVVSVVSDVLTAGETAPGEVLSVQRIEKLLSCHGETNNNGSLVPFSFCGDLLSVEQEVCLSALTSCLEESVTGDTSGSGGKLEFQHGFGTCSSGDDVAQYKQLHSVAEQELRHLLVTFRAYITMYGREVGTSNRVTLSPFLTSWLLGRAAELCTSDRGDTAELTPAVLFEEASTALLRKRLDFCGIDISMGAAVQQDAGTRSRWSALLLLQHMTLLSGISDFSTRGRHASLTAEGERSLLYAILLRLRCDAASYCSAGGVQRQYVDFWTFLQSLLSIVSVRLLYNGAKLFTFSRPSLVEVGRRLAKDIEVQFEKKILMAEGWMPWTDAQMFSEQHRAAYTASGYAQTHLPVFARSFMATLLNTLLLNTLRAARREGHFCQSPVSAVIFSGDKSDDHLVDDASANIDSLTACVTREQRLHGSVKSRCGIRLYAEEAMALVGLLHDEGATMLAQRRALMDEFSFRQESFDEREKVDHIKARKGPGADGKSPHDDRKIHIFDKLLPKGSVVVCGDAFGLLLRVLLEGRAAFKALRLATSAVHAARMLRHASRLPAPSVEISKRIKYKRVRNSRTGRKHLVRVSVPVLRSVDPEADGQRYQNKGHGCAQSTALHLQINQKSVVEVVRLTLHMKAVGERLLQGVINDCVKGLLVDYSTERCLPVLTGADVCDDGTISDSLGARELKRIFSVVGIVVCGAKPLPMADDIPQQVAVGYRVPPSKLLVELLVSLSPPADYESRRRHIRLCCMDPYLVNERTLLVQQYLEAKRHFVQASSSAASAWLSYLNIGAQMESRATCVALFRKEAEELPIVTDFVRPLRAAPPPQNLSELRDKLAQVDTGDYDSRDQKAREFGWSVFQRVAASATDHSTVHCVWWAAMGGNLLGVTNEALSGRQLPWGRLLLRNAFHIAQQFSSQRDRQRYTQATMKLFLLADFFDTSSAAPDTSRSNKCVEDLPWNSATVRDIRLFLAAQLHLAEQLHKRSLKTFEGYENEFQRQKRDLDVMLQLKGLTALGEEDIEATTCWKLLEPLLNHTNMVFTWLQESTFNPSQEFIAWLIVRTNKNCDKSRLLLAKWIDLLYQTGNITNRHHQKIATEIEKSAKRAAKTPR